MSSGGAGVFTHSERDFQVLSAPDVHACVIGADLLEIISVDGEQAARHGGSPGGGEGGSVPPSFSLSLRVTQSPQIFLHFSALVLLFLFFTVFLLILLPLVSLLNGLLALF